MTTIFVAKLDFGVTENELLTLFQQYGTVAKVNVAKDKETNKSRGFAFIEMPDTDQAKKAIDALDGYSFNGRKCVIKEADARPGNNKAGGDQQRFQRDSGNFRPRTDSPTNRDNREQRTYQKPGNSENPNRRDDFSIPVHEEDRDAPTSLIPKIPVIKKKKETEKPKPFDDTADGKNKKQKMNAYKKSGKDSLYIDDEDEDDELDLFGRNEDDDLEDDYSKYLVNSDDDDEDWEEDEWEEDEDWEDDDQD